MNTVALQNSWTWERLTKNDRLADLRNFALVQAEQHNQLREDLDRLLAYFSLEIFEGRELRAKKETK